VSWFTHPPPRANTCACFAPIGQGQGRARAGLISRTRSPTRPPGPRPRVLVAEDDGEMRRLLRRALEREECEVIECLDGRELLSVVSELRTQNALPHLVVTDLRMPLASGFEVLAALQAEALSIPFILITGFCDTDTLREAARLGVSCVLSKPFDMDLLRSAALCVLSGSAAGDPSSGE
jgi:DNA-binding NtrC family response regulator